MVVFGIRIQGSCRRFVAVCVSTALMASCFGLLIASLGKTPQATRGWRSWPCCSWSCWVARGCRRSSSRRGCRRSRWPSRALGVDGLDATTWRGVDSSAILPTVGVLLGFAAVFGPLAVARFRWDAE
jgi:ABC-2 type transport system permease protein